MSLYQSPVPGTCTIPLGRFEVTTILDGKSRRDNPHETFGIDQSRDEVSALLAANHLPTDHFVHCFVPVLVRTGQGLILFDTGFGPMGRAQGNGQLRARLGEMGISANDITTVVLTHMHGDHIGGLMEEDGPAFPNATYRSSRTEFEFWTSPDRMGSKFEGGHQLAMRNVKPLQSRMSFLADGQQVVPGIVAREAFGHSPGQLVFELESEGQHLMLTADVANHAVLSLQRPDWRVVFDYDGDAAAMTRKRIFGDIADWGVPFIGHHMPYPSIGYVERLGEGFRYVPASYQFET